MRSEILWGTYTALSEKQPALSSIEDDLVDRAVVWVGPIVAWGKSDIDDPKSELHRRFEIGVTTRGGYHGVDPGKLTSAPFLADECARRIVGEPPQADLSMSQSVAYENER